MVNSCLAVVAVILPCSSGFGAEEGMEEFLRASPDQRASIATAGLENASQAINVEYRRSLEHAPDYLQEIRGHTPDEPAVAHNGINYLRINDRMRIEKYVLHKKADGFDSEPQPSHVTVFDGQIRLSWSPGKDDVSPVGKAVLSQGEPIKGLEDRGIVDLLFIPDAPVSDVLNAKDVVTKPSDETLLGVPTVSVSAPVTINRVEYQVEYWLAPSRGYLPLRGEIRNKIGHVVFRKEVEAIKELADGIWWPTKARLSHFGEDPKRNTPLQTTAFDVTHVDLNPQIPDENTFNTSLTLLPSGVSVTDLIIDEHYETNFGPRSDDAIDIIVQQVNKQTAKKTNSTKAGLGTRPAEADIDKAESIAIVAESSAQRKHFLLMRLFWVAAGCIVVAIACIVGRVVRRTPHES